MRSSGSSGAIVEHQQQAEELVANYQESLELRDAAAERGDAAAWHIHDADCETLEHDWDRYYAAAPAAAAGRSSHGRVFQTQENFSGPPRERCCQCDGYGASVRDQAPNRQHQPRTHWHGSCSPVRRNTFKAMDDLLEMYAGDFGLKYDPKEDTVTPNEAARISNVSPDEYNQGRQGNAPAGQKLGCGICTAVGQKGRLMAALRKKYQGRADIAPSKADSAPVMSEPPARTSMPPRRY